MPFDLDSIENAVAEARMKGTERGIKFEQSFDIAVNFRSKEMDVSKPENRLNQEVVLRHPLYPPAKICAFGDGEFAEKASAAGVDQVVPKEEIPKVGEDKKTRKELAVKYDFFIASTDAPGRTVPRSGPRTQRQDAKAIPPTSRSGTHCQTVPENNSDKNA